MEKLDLPQQLDLLQKQIETLGSVIEDTKFELLSAIGTIKIEVEVLKRFIA